MTQKDNELGQQTIYVDLGDKREETKEKPLIPEGEKHGILKNFDIVRIRKFGTKINETVDKILIEVEIPEYKKTIPFFLTPIVSKAYSSKQSNSKCYDLLEATEQLESFSEFIKEHQKMSAKDLANYLSSVLKDTHVRVSVETVKGEKPYSVVKKVYGLNQSTF